MRRALAASLEGEKWLPQVGFCCSRENLIKYLGTTGLFPRYLSWALGLTGQCHSVGFNRYLPLSLRDFYRDGVAVSLNRVSQELWNYLAGRASYHLSCTVFLCGGGGSGKREEAVRALLSRFTD